ncbi:MAG TPA: dienelactone hydrolase family protein [Sphingobium sp.]
MATIDCETIAYRAGDLRMQGSVYRDAGRHEGPAVLLFPEAPGPGANVRSRAERLASAGYTAFVSDLHGHADVITDRAEMIQRMEVLRGSAEITRMRARAALDALVNHRGGRTGGIAAIGFCFGGTMALELGRDGAELGAIIGFHSGLRPLGSPDSGPMRGPVLVCIGADDPSITIEDRMAFEAEMQGRSAQWSLHVYGGVRHSFTDTNADQIGRPEFARYDATADLESWAAMSRLLSRTIGV